MATDAAAPGGQAGGAIHDLGYRHYTGPRLGRRAIVRALGWHSFRTALGFGRGAKAKIVPVTAFAVMCLPALVNALLVARSTDHARVIPYDTYIFQLRALVLTIFVAAQAPELVSRDLRSHVLPLYFSRPVRRLDYPLAKYAAFTAACLVLVEIPLLLLYLGTIVSVSGLPAIWGETRALVPGVAAGALWAVLLAALGLALASFTSRRAYATGTIAICFFLSWTLAQILVQTALRAGQATAGGVPLAARLGGLVSPFSVIDGVRQWLGGTSPGRLPPPGSAGAVYGVMFGLLLAASLGGLAARYRKAGAA